VVATCSSPPSPNSGTLTWQLRTVTLLPAASANCPLRPDRLCRRKCATWWLAQGQAQAQAQAQALTQALTLAQVQARVQAQVQVQAQAQVQVQVQAQVQAQVKDPVSSAMYRNP
jgi:hypothetical protein